MTATLLKALFAKVALCLANSARLCKPHSHQSDSAEAVHTAVGRLNIGCYSIVGRHLKLQLGWCI